VNQKGKHTSMKTPPMHGLDGPARVASARERRGANGAGWAKGRVGRKVGRAESEEKKIELKIGFLNLPRLWKFAQGDLGGILT
jgi:hypothetical protein